MPGRSSWGGPDFPTIFWRAGSLGWVGGVGWLHETEEITRAGSNILPNLNRGSRLSVSKEDISAGRSSQWPIIRNPDQQSILVGVDGPGLCHGDRVLSARDVATPGLSEVCVEDRARM
jgi:hypothetical protein